MTRLLLKNKINKKIRKILIKVFPAPENPLPKNLLLKKYSLMLLILDSISPQVKSLVLLFLATLIDARDKKERVEDESDDPQKYYG